jgi:ribose-phosphate pyrophosphokinase
MMGLLLMIDAAKQAGARCFTVVIPYLGYMRQDCAHHAGGPIGTRLQANLLAAAVADRMITCDLHVRHIVKRFELLVEHLVSTSFFIPYIRNLQLSRVTFVSPDTGGVARVKLHAQHFDAPLVFCKKHRS